MAMAETRLLLCDCLKSQSIDAKALQDATGLACSSVCTELCGSQAMIAEKAIRDGNTIIACRQEQAFFEEIADDLDLAAPGFIDIRDRAGWTDDTRDTAPKMATLIADAMLETPPAKALDVESAGTCLIFGEPDAALEAARHLCDTLSVTVLLETASEDHAGGDRRFDLVLGRLRRVTGALGGFKLELDALQERVRGGRGAPVFTNPQDGARSQCDIIVDLSGATPLVQAPEKREGYLRADPRHGDARLAAILEAAKLVGTFEKPLYVRVEESLCAHKRAEKTGCTRCLDLCPTGAIAPEGDHVLVDPMVCAGCGSCSAVCPSGAISYDAPPVASVMRRIETLASNWRRLSKTVPHLLIHDSKHGAEMIRLSARYGKGLPADVIPMEMSAPGAFGHAEALAALACGFGSVTLMVSPTMERDGLPMQVELTNAVAGRTGFDLIEPADPDAFDALMWRDRMPVPRADPILPMGSRRQVARVAAKTLNAADAQITLPEGAPYGAVQLDNDACTLCLACVSLCPSGALVDNPDLPQVRFQEDACLQCGICVSVCPENALTLEPRLNLSDLALSQVVLNEEEPFACIECGTLFGVKSTVERILDQLAGKHAMFANESASRMIQMCDNCRVTASHNSENNPFTMGERPRVRTTEDYLRADDESGSKRRDH